MRPLQKRGWLQTWPLETIRLSEGDELINRNTLLGVVTALGAAFFFIFGLWPFFDPRSFFDEVAGFEPYNAHFLHDVGAFQVGIGAALAVALWRRTDAILAALAGAGIGAALHAAAHIRDHDLGGSDRDTTALVVVAVVLLVAVGWKLASQRT